MTNVYIEHDGKIVFMRSSTSLEIATKKTWFIAKQIAKTSAPSMSEIEALADLWINKKTLGVTYPEHIEKMLSDA